MGCTEPIAVAYAAAMARDLLGSMPVRMEVNVSGNILKNVKSVVVPNTGGLRGIQAAAAAGAAVGQAERELEVIAQVTSEQVGEIRTFLERCPIQVGLAATSQIFYIEVLAFGGDGSSSEAAISGFHTNVIRKRKNGQTLLQREEAAERESPCDEKSLLSIEGALEFADTVELDDVRALVQRQIDYNYAIAQEGLRGNYGANIGSVLLKHDGDDVKVRAKAYAAAGSDARMNGCELPVVIVSGSGNQGITASVPVVVYAKELGASEEKMLRAVVLSRGYKAQPPELPLHVSPSRTPGEAGDEPLMLALEHPSAAVMVDPDRRRSGRWAEERLSPDLFVLDDGFQHLSTGRDLDLVLLDKDDVRFSPAPGRPPSNWNRIIPAGSWREPVSALQSAAAFLIKAEPEEWPELIPALKARLRNFSRPVFAFCMEPAGLRPVGKESEQSGFLGPSAVGGPYVFALRHR